MSEREVIIEMNQAIFKEAMKDVEDKGKVLVIKFSASWCKPCQRCKPVCEEWFTKMPDNVILVELDIDEQIDIYATLKSRRMINGIPAILAWYPESEHDHDPWYVPDDIVNDSATNSIDAFFKRVIEVANEYKPKN